MNVIVVMMDSLRQDHVGAFGNDWIHTPHMDAFASEAMRFNNAYAEGLPTGPVRTALLTGRYTFMYRPWMPFLLSDFTIGEALTHEGYKTAWIGDCYHYNRRGINFQRGFEYYELIRGQEHDKWLIDESIPIETDKYFRSRPDEPERSARWKMHFEKYLRNISIRKTEEDFFPAQVTNATINWLDRQKKLDNIFLWVEYFDPHEPWDPPQKYRDLYEKDYQGQDIINPMAGPVEGYLTPEELEHIKALYAGEVTLVDHWLGVLYEKIRELGMLDNTMIVYLSDHGNPFGERGYIKKTGPWLHDDVSKIVCMVRHPKGLGAGKASNAIVQTPDLMPTVLELLEVDGPDTVQGESMLPLLKEETDSQRDFAYIGRFGDVWAIKNQKWSLIKYFKDGCGKHAGELELFNLKEDPGEQVNVLETHPEIACKMEQELLRFVKEMEDRPKGKDGEVLSIWEGHK
ncbi:sulfatase [Candidatus Hydrogenedentota bacterium]